MEEPQMTRVADTHDSGLTDCTQAGRGFSRLPAAERKQLAAAGGRAAHACGRAHEFSPDEASVAGRRGGLRVSADRSHMAALGRLGSAQRAANRRHRDSAGSRPADAPAPQAPQQPGATLRLEEQE